MSYFDCCCFFLSFYNISLLFPLLSFLFQGFFLSFLIIYPYLCLVCLLIDRCQKIHFKLSTFYCFLSALLFSYFLWFSCCFWLFSLSFHIIIFLSLSSLLIYRCQNVYVNDFHNKEMKLILRSFQIIFLLCRVCTLRFVCMY